MTRRDDLTNHGSGSGCCAGKRSNTDHAGLECFRFLVKQPGQAAHRADIGIIQNSSIGLKRNINMIVTSAIDLLLTALNRAFA